MLASFGAWLAKLDPNIAIPVLVALVTFGYHSLFSPSAQAKIAAAVNDAFELAERAVNAALAVAPAGTTAAQLVADLESVAKAQLAHAGLDPSKLPPVVLSLVQALVKAAIAKWQATNPAPQSADPAAPNFKPQPALPAPQTVPVIAIPPTTPSGAAKGTVRMPAIIAIAAVALSADVMATVEACGGKSVGTIALQTGQCVLDSGVEAQVLVALATQDYAAAVADLATSVAPTLIKCALQAIAGGAAGSGNGSGSASTAAAVPGDAASHAKDLLANPDKWQKTPAQPSGATW